MSGAAIRPMTDADVGEVVEVHMLAFPSFFLTFLGPRFLRELYRGIVEDPTGIAYVAVDGSRCAGFVAGTAVPSAFYRRLLVRRWFRFGLASVVPLLRRPSIAGRLLRAFAKPAGAASSGSGRAELMSIAVSPLLQQKGLGAALVSAFSREAARRGSAAVYLTTDAAANDAVNRFYENLGFALTRRFTTAEGRSMNEYERRLD